MSTDAAVPAHGDASTAQGGLDSGDPLAAFLDGLSRLADAGLGGATGSALPAGAPVTMLSNGLNADAGVAQLVSALASVHEGNAAFDATPFAAPSDADLQGVIAPEVH
jgi:hypothetical protein